MAGLNIAEVIARHEANPDPIFEAFLTKNRLARILEQINGLLSDAYEQLGDLDKLHDQVASRMVRDVSGQVFHSED